MKRLLVLALVLSFPAAAMATECEADADCGEGYFCEMLPCTCAMPACENPDDCEQYECPPCLGECVAEGSVEDPGSGWTTGECEADSDCPMGFACVEITYGYCGGAMPECPPCECACEEGQSCDCEAECLPCEESEPAPCEEGTMMVCEYQPQTCTADTDCADGFECVAQEACTDYDTNCVTSACICPTCPEGETCEPCDCPEEEYTECDEPSEPVCETVGSYCVPKQIECTQDSDCPADFTCAEMPVACPAIACDCMCEEGAECNCEDQCQIPECTEEAVSYCLPGGWYDAGFSDAAALGSENFMEKGVTAAADTQTEEPTGVPVDENEETGGVNATGDDSSSSGCTASVAGSSNVSMLALLALSLLLLAALRKVRA